MNKDYIETDTAIGATTTSRVTICSATGLDDPLTREQLIDGFSEAERARLNRKLNWEKMHVANHKKKVARRKAKQRAKDSRKRNR